MDSREVTPELTRAVIHLTGEVRSFERAAVTLRRVVGQTISASTIRRLAKQVGQELADPELQSQRSDAKQVVVPAAAVVSCDGGRIRTRQPGQGRGVVLSGENGWRETKNASFERMTLNKGHSDSEDSCPELPTSFRTVEKVAKIAENSPPSIDASPGQPRDCVVYEGPDRVLRTAISSMASSDEFGPLMQQEARRRRFYESPLRAFLGDGLNWNWSIWKDFFPTFVPILDFIHAIQYVFSAAMALGLEATEAWATYVKFVTLCWQGDLDEVIEQLTDVCHARGVPLQERIADDAPYKPITDAIRYLQNNRTRMDYPRYRCLGLPVTSAPMESLIKQINLRVKGTEMFWDDPDGAEAILHIRAAAISEDDRLDSYLSKRLGWPFVRRTSEVNIAA